MVALEILLMFVLGVIALSVINVVLEIVGFSPLGGERKPSLLLRLGAVVVLAAGLGWGVSNVRGATDFVVGLDVQAFRSTTRPIRVGQPISVSCDRDETSKCQEVVRQIKDGYKEFSSLLSQCKVDEAWATLSSHPNAISWEKDKLISASTGIDWQTEDCAVGKKIIYDIEIKHIAIEGDTVAVILDDSMTLTLPNGGKEVVWAKDGKFDMEIFKLLDDKWATWILFMTGS